MKLKKNDFAILSEFDKIKILHEKIHKLLDIKIPVIITGDDFCCNSIVFLFKNSIKLNISELLDNNAEIMTEAVTKLSRRSVHITTAENFNVVVGEVVNINNHQIQLRTTEMESVFEISDKLLKEFRKENVVKGSIVKIYRELGLVQNLGFSHVQGDDADTHLVNVPTKEIIKMEKNYTDITLDELDIINSNNEDTIYNYSNIFIDKNIQREVDDKIYELLAEKEVTVARYPVVIYLNKDSEIEHLSFIANIIAKQNVPCLFVSKENKSYENMVTVKIPDLDKNEISELFLKTLLKNNVEFKNKAFFDRTIELCSVKNYQLILKMLLCSIKNKQIDEKFFSVLLENCSF